MCYIWRMEGIAMKNHLQEICEAITAMVIIVMVILAGVGGISLSWKLIGYLLGAH